MRIPGNQGSVFYSSSSFSLRLVSIGVTFHVGLILVFMVYSSIELKIEDSTLIVDWLGSYSGSLPIGTVER